MNLACWSSELRAGSLCTLRTVYVALGLEDRPSPARRAGCAAHGVRIVTPVPVPVPQILLQVRGPADGS